VQPEIQAITSLLKQALNQEALTESGERFIYVVCSAVLAFISSWSERKRKTTQAAKSSSHQLRKRGRLGRKAPSPDKKKAVGEDQEGCGRSSQQTSPD